MYADLISQLLSQDQKRSLKREFVKIKANFIDFFFSYSAKQLKEKLVMLGITSGDTVLMHNSFGLFSGFKGRPQQVIDSILEVIGASGNLLMMSMAYSGSGLDYLKAGKPFSVSRTPSMMGLLTEIFRRRKGVLRSWNPIHPILALGPKAAWIIEGHHNIVYSAGRQSPFEKILGLDAKILFFNVDFLTCTFLHYLEDCFKDQLPVNVYYKELQTGVIIGPDCNTFDFESYVFDPKTVKGRDEIWLQLKRDLKKKRLLKKMRIGNTTLTLVHSRDLVNRATELIQKGVT